MDSHYPKVSIITPSYNQAQFIEKTINSVITQDYPNIEYLILDGGSTDGSIDIIKKYQDKLAYWVSEPDKGQSDALNKGFKKATGDIVAWINSDDMYVDDAIPRAAKFFIENPEVDLAYGNCDVIDEQGNVLIYQRAPDFELKKLVRTVIIPQPSVFMKRKMLEELGYLDESLRYTMDYDLWLRAAKKYNIRHIDAILSCFRLHGSSKTVSESIRFLPENYRILNEFFSGIGDKKSSLYPQYTAHLSQILSEMRDTDVRTLAGCILGAQVSETEVSILASFFSGEQVTLRDLNDVKAILQKGYQDLYMKFINPYGNMDNFVTWLVYDQLLHFSQRLFMEGQAKKSRKILRMILKDNMKVILQNPLSYSLALNYLLTRGGVRLIDSTKYECRLQLRKAWIYINHRV